MFKIQETIFVDKISGSKYRIRGVFNDAYGDINFSLIGEHDTFSDYPFILFISFDELNKNYDKIKKFPDVEYKADENLLLIRYVNKIEPETRVVNDYDELSKEELNSIIFSKEYKKCMKLKIFMNRKIKNQNDTN